MRNAYRAKARETHPDKHPGKEAEMQTRFLEVVAAFELWPSVGVPSLGRAASARSGRVARGLPCGPTSSRDLRLSDENERAPRAGVYPILV